MLWTVYKIQIDNILICALKLNVYYAEMVECMKKVAKLDLDLTVEERNLLSVGYKNVIGARRASWRIMSSIEQKEESKGNEHNVKLIKSYCQKVEEELSKICGDILTIIDQHLIPSSGSAEASVFYYKMWVMLLPCCATCLMNSIPFLVLSAITFISIFFFEYFLPLSRYNCIFWLKAKRKVLVRIW